MISGCGMPHMYKSQEIHGWVIDADTKKPVSNVVVLIAWGLEGGWHIDHTGYLVIEETVTDEDGYYRFESWGPKFTTDELRSYDPEINYIKMGYLPEGRFNESIAPYNRTWSNHSEWTDKTIELQVFDNRLSGGIKEYENKVSGFASVLQPTSGREAFICVWKKVPRFTATLINFKYMFNKYGINSSLPDINQLKHKSCADPQDILGEYLEKD